MAVLTGRRPELRSVQCLPDGRRDAGGARLPADPGLPARRDQRGNCDTPTSRSRAVNTASRRRGRRTASASTSAPSIARESLDFQVDNEFPTGDLAGQGGPTPPVNGQFDVRELFGEVQIPIVEHNFIDLLQISAGYRYSDYKVHGAGLITASTPTPTRSRLSSRRSATSGSAPATTARFALRTSSSCSSRQRSASLAAVDPCAGASRHREPRRNARLRACRPRSTATSRRTRPISIMACSAATRTLMPEKADTDYGRCHHSAALRSGACADGRLLQHQGQGPDRCAEFRRYIQRLLWRRRLGLRP